MIGSLIIGALCGWIASMIMKTDAQMGALANIIVGLIGGVIGGWIFSLLNIASTGLIGDIIAGVIGSVVLIFIYNAITGKNK
ncbi:GlsB/YeaQ/YmgE family stress response membrane protein [Anaerococcus sp. AGMB00486]|uniref:GlsB/YeaQ/YmgE family stress response membrane protein n=2 Tax=Anaerococcus TaxID=165779 RepID=A0ABX2NBI8_9FIRM|nr:MULTISPECIES: GlsB/YeaQ/YmgE family stress response membrane protein [Anaerococcus]MDY3005503.1 GlsB/YeaQ/YmgE family stress response membrane protein [Anaerococcus porci]MSS78237.1 GlsB/YeaQ/YmgE family stress response membrane protein [Anaerococcus porci]NVF11995.1 GlsB/YeaQ/YmgE family stress response membrane protein [Anaerococcus faecalis]